MVAPLKVSKDTPSPAVVDLFSGTKTADSISKTHTEELVIALCGPIGSPLHEVADAIDGMLTGTFGYEKCTQIRLSNLISEYASKVSKEIPTRFGYEKIGYP